MWANNETGVLFPVAQIAEICRSRGVLYHCDAVQAAGKVPSDVRKVSAEYLSLTGLRSGEFTSPHEDEDLENGGVKPPLVRLKACLTGEVKVLFRQTRTCNRLQLRRRAAGWGAAGGERPVRRITNSIRPT